MKDVEKIKQALICQKTVVPGKLVECTGCAYSESRDCLTEVTDDVIELLGEYEERIAIMTDGKPENEPVMIEWRFGFPHCPACGQMQPEGDAVKYCLHCGRPVMWRSLE